jgi:hypothetical protein
MSVESLDKINEDVPFEMAIATEKAKRNRVVNSIDAILAGRARKISIEVPDEPKLRNQRIQKVLMYSENNYKHLLGEVTGEKYNIPGRPELELLKINFELPRKENSKRVANRKFRVKGDSDDEENVNDDEPPTSVSDMLVLYCSGKDYFLLSPKVEDNLLAALSDYPNYDLIIKSTELLFGHYSFSFPSPVMQRLWRRFVREKLLPQLNDEDRMQLMEDRLNFEILYEDDEVPEKEANTDDDEEEEEDEEAKKRKKKGKKKKGHGKKKAGKGDDSDGPLASGTTTSSSAAGGGGGGAAAAAAGRASMHVSGLSKFAPTGSGGGVGASAKRGVGLLAKRASQRVGGAGT